MTSNADSSDIASRVRELRLLSLVRGEIDSIAFRADKVCPAEVGVQKLSAGKVGLLAIGSRQIRLRKIDFECAAVGQSLEPEAEEARVIQRTPIEGCREQ
jgi:hypothetical protein